MFEGITNFFKKLKKSESTETSSKETAKERLHLVLMQDRANVSADFLEMMKQEIIEVIKKYIDVDENAIDVRLTNKANDDGTNGAPALYANIPIISIKQEKKEEAEKLKKEEKKLETDNKKDNEKKEQKNETKEIKEVKKEEKKDNKNTSKKVVSKTDKNNIDNKDSNLKKEKGNNTNKLEKNENSKQILETKK